MKIIKCEQGSPEWYVIKCGIPSASNFDKIVTTKGTPSKQRTKYLYKLAGEKIAGVTEENYQNATMARGSEMEPEARRLYEIAKDVEVEQVGFCISGDYGASPDGLVGEHGLVEIKCPIASTHVGYLLKDVVPTDYYQQLQGQLLVTGRQWVDFVSYYPGIKPLIIRVDREDKFIDYLEAELVGFCAELNQIVKEIL
jgi:putative phage-type endonuclease